MGYILWDLWISNICCIVIREKDGLEKNLQLTGSTAGKGQASNIQTTGSLLGDVSSSIEATNIMRDRRDAALRVDSKVRDLKKLSFHRPSTAKRKQKSIVHSLISGACFL